MQVTCINRKRGGYTVFCGGCTFFYTFFSYIFNKNKEDCIFLINISCFGGFLLRKVQKSWFWKTILWLNLWLKLWLNSGFVLKLSIDSVGLHTYQEAVIPHFLNPPVEQLLLPLQSKWDKFLLTGKVAPFHWHTAQSIPQCFLWGKNLQVRKTELNLNSSWNLVSAKHCALVSYWSFYGN